MPGAPTHTWYCSVFLRTKRMLGCGGRTSGARSFGPRVGVLACLRWAFWSRTTSSSCLRFPAAATTTFPARYIVWW
jgi:hypothetical protein